MGPLQTGADRIGERLRGFRFVCVSNRQPYSHHRTPSGLRCAVPVGGVVSALDPILQATGGTWIAHGNGSADREVVDGRSRVRVPPGAARYTLRRVWLTKEEEDGYYAGFSNRALWPLCHIAYQRPAFEEREWRCYERVNEKFADVVADEVGDERALVFIQDYHFALLSRLVKRRLPSAIVCQFWHIPWPNPEVFRICPWKQEILEGLLGNDLLAFHIQFHCNNFLETVDRELESRIDRETLSVTFRGSHTLVQPHPISVDFEALSAAAASSATAAQIAELRRRYRLEGRRVALGIDRLDYTKGIVERLRAVDRFLERHPEFRGEFSFLEVGIPSRDSIPAYRAYREEVASLVRSINERHRTPGWTPVILEEEVQDRPALAAYYRLADLCLVTPVHDGMNLVAKEFVASRGDGGGVLLLSEFAGAARELTHAVLVNPYAVDALAEAIAGALRMPPEEQRTRMERLRETVREHDVYRWVGRLLEQASRLEPS